MSSKLCMNNFLFESRDWFWRWYFWNNDKYLNCVRALEWNDLTVQPFQKYHNITIFNHVIQCLTFFAGNIIWGVLSREKATKMASSRNVKQPPGAGMFDPASKLQSNTLKVFCSSELFMNLKCLQFLQQVVYFMNSASLS